MASTETMLVYYNVVNESGSPIKQQVSVPHGSTAQNVMEMGANQNAELRFQVTYYNTELGYFVDKIGDTANAPPKYWILYVGNGDLTPSTVGISNYHPTPNSTVEMRFENTTEDHPLHGFKECMKGK